MKWKALLDLLCSNKYRMCVTYNMTMCNLFVRSVQKRENRLNRSKQQKHHTKKKKKFEILKVEKCDFFEMSFFRMPAAFSKDFLLELVALVLPRMSSGEFVADQLHFVAMPFALKNTQLFGEVLSQALRERYPGCTAKDFCYVNDFVAPVNLQNANIHTSRPDNKYELHIDGVDRFVGPCFNVWIPLFDNEDAYDLETLLEVKAGDSRWYEQHYLYCLANKTDLLEESSAVEFCKATRINVDDDSVLFFDVRKGKLVSCATTELERGMIGVQRGALGDAVVFESALLHRSGKSSFPRVGFSFKFLYKPALEFRRKPHEPMDLGDWMGLYVMSICQNPDDVMSFVALVPHAIASKKNLKRISKQKTQTCNIIAKLERIRQKLK
jgi:hypothetical protein